MLRPEEYLIGQPIQIGVLIFARTNERFFMHVVVDKNHRRRTKVIDVTKIPLTNFQRTCVEMAYLSNRKIAMKLGVSMDEVKRGLGRAFRKLGITFSPKGDRSGAARREAIAKLVQMEINLAAA